MVIPKAHLSDKRFSVKPRMTESHWQNSLPEGQVPISRDSAGGSSLEGCDAGECGRCVG